jgi:hypothetical protein
MAIINLRRFAMHRSSEKLGKLEMMISVLGRMDPQVEFMLTFIAALPALLTNLIATPAKQ